MLASGAYFVAVAADKIYVNPSSITGSIGVIMKGFGFPDALKKLGIERRVYTSGADKDRLDPFLPQSPEDVEKIKQVIQEVHDNFIQVVVEGRKGKLKADEKTLFSGDFWSGPSAVKLGLVDGLGNEHQVMQDEFKVSRYKDYSQSQSVVKALLGQMKTSMDTLLNQSSVLLQ
jgi:ClpP class serine protease